MPLAKVQRKIVNKLLQMGRLSPEQAEQLINTDRELPGEAMENLLMEDFKITRYQIMMAQAKAVDLHPFNAKHFKPSMQAFDVLDKTYCRENRILPVGRCGGYTLIAVVDPFNLGILSEVQSKIKGEIKPLLALEKDVMPHLKEEEKQAETSVEFSDVMANLDMEFQDEELEVIEDEDPEESAPIIQLANRIIEDAYFSGGSDVHIEPFEQFTRVRVRVDGVLQEKLTVPPKVSGALLARMKIMANLDIAEKRLPQDGRIVFKQFTKKDLDIDLRISTAPLNHGEGVVMRILDKTKSTLPLPALGFSEENLVLYRELIKQPYGMVLHCGPTGSGKSMTLYSALNEINSPDVCIRTAEDPIEYTLPGLCQMQMNRRIGLTFAAALRAFLRQDPDIILVGEIRDSETAQIAIEASLTGHMLFSTLHTNDAPSTIARMGEMKIEPFMISASMTIICAQRLMRRVCKTCKQMYEPEGREADLLEKAIKWVGKIPRANPTGCPTCNGSGYKGRVGIHELLATSEELVKGINAELEAAKLKRIAVRNGMRTLHQDSILKVKQGLSTIEEAVRVVPPDMEDIDKIISAKTLEEALAD